MKQIAFDRVGKFLITAAAGLAVAAGGLGAGTAVAPEVNATFDGLRSNLASAGYAVPWEGPLIGGQYKPVVQKQIPVTDENAIWVAQELAAGRGGAGG